MLLNAERPVMFVGQSIRHGGAAAELLALAERLQIPVAASMSGLGAIDTHHPLALGMVARGGHYQANHATRQADVLLSLGARFDDRTSSSWIPGYSFTIPPTKLIHVDIDPEEIGRNYPVALGLMADVRTFLRQVLAELDRRTDIDQQARRAQASGSDEIDGYRKEWDKLVAPGFTDDSQPINPQRAAFEIDRGLPEDAILVSDIGVHHNWLLGYCKPRRPDSMIGWMGFGAMGFGVAGVLGAKFAAPDRPCVSVCGDGAFFMHANVLGTAVEYDLPVVWVVWNNYAYASIRGLQRGYLGGRELATDFHDPKTGAALQSRFRRDGALGRRRGRARRSRRRSRRGGAQGHRGEQAISDRRRHRRRHQSGRRRRLGTARPWAKQAIDRHALRAGLIAATPPARPECASGSRPARMPSAPEPDVVGDPRRAGHHNDAPADLQGLVDRMRDEHGGLAVLAHEAGEFLAQPLAGDLVERGERLVAQQNARIGREGARDAHPLAHPAGECVRKVILVARKAEPREPETAPLAAFGRRLVQAFQARARHCRSPCATATAGRSGTRPRSCRADR